ncbi:hypothetical protein [Falsiphaeobacter marinintestinus]|uniref:hypothetical protein n=1 Tax=Falsiphaeobacter marinintestinus TaxID=1492905 RepID=UPI0011B6ECC9|nr:hypothetical protein [Phaeobacter marinintestinus]
MTDSIQSDGVRNMLQNCGKAQPGQHLLVAFEPESHGYYDQKVVDLVSAEAAKMGLTVSRLDVGFDPHRPAMSQQLSKRIIDADIVVFLARLGDQLRFSEMPQGTTIINSYTLNAHLLQSTFASAHYDAFVALKTAVDRCIARSDQITVTCPAGTAFEGKSDLKGASAVDTTLRRFPMSVFSPVPAAEFSGKVALGGFLTGTGSRYYDKYTVEFDGQVFAIFENGRLSGFEGAPHDTAKANAHYDRVSSLFEIDRNFVHSWHAGIHPGCGFPWALQQDYLQWGGAAFGNPRVLHFHTCGAYAPGEISWNVFDPTIEIDGVRLWDHGRFRADRLEEGPGILDRYRCAAEVFENPDRNIGLADTR